MKKYRVRTDLTRAVVNGFALPLGLEAGNLAAPTAGYTVSYNAGEEDDPDTYTYQIAVSHERLAELCARCFELLPDDLYGIIEIGSRDAYRSVDVYLGVEPIPATEFRSTWKLYESFLLEDGTIAAGANAEEPFVEVFVDQRKMVILHVPLPMQDEVEALLHSFGLEQVPETWPDLNDGDGSAPVIRPVLDVTDVQCPDVDELLLQLRHSWRLQLNLDPDGNLDEAGRSLGMTLWHAVVIIFRDEEESSDGAYMSVWLTAGSLAQAEELIQEEIDRRPEWSFGDFYTIDRVAFDERPDSMADLPPRRTEAEIHLVSFDVWDDVAASGGPGAAGSESTPPPPPSAADDASPND